MAASPRRLLKLAQTLDRLREVLAARLATLQHERQHLLGRRAAIEALMASDTRFLDLTLGGALKRLKEISAAVSVIDGQAGILRKRSADAFLKAKRARQAAAQRLAEAARERARLDLSELADARVAASLRQAKDG
jgi:hypothetical protein